VEPSSNLNGLWGHQVEGIHRALAKGSYGFFFEAGTGKTRTTIEVLRHIYTQHNEALKTLIVAPQVVCPNWKAEFAKFSKIPERMIEVLEGSGKERTETIKTTDARILICNYHTLNMLPAFDALRAWAPKVMIADESHRIKNPKAMMTKRAIALAIHAQYKYILSGTPILQNAMDAFSQFMFLDGGKTFGVNYFTFRRRYFQDLNASIRARSPQVTWAKWAPIKHREAELKTKISNSSLSVRKSECLDLPPFVRQRVAVPLSNEQMKAYEEMRKYMITFVGTEACTAQMALHKALRLQQITSGFLGSDDGSEHDFKNVPRLDALKELLEDLCESEKVIVWACWRNNQRAIRDMLAKTKIGFRELIGDSSHQDRQQAMEDFRRDPNVRVILGSQGAGGIGVNLVEASYAIYYSRNFSLEQDVQSEARNYRGGSEIHGKITRIDLVAPGTIDDDVLKALEQKQEISDRVIFQCLKK
jgi:SNF2 family DNA or RNA helicase